MLVHGQVTETIIGAAIEVHRHLGPGMLELVYEECLCHELSLKGLAYQRQVKVPVTYKAIRLDGAYRLDVIVENLVIVELKCVEAVLPVHEAQLLTYLRLTGKRAGLLINFDVPVLKDGITRKVR